MLLHNSHMLLRNSVTLHNIIFSSEEIWLKFDQENQFCKWYAALKLGCKGTTMASNNYKLEIDRLKQVIKIQDLSTEKIHDQSELQAVQSKFYVPRKYFKKVFG